MVPQHVLFIDHIQFDDVHLYNVFVFISGDNRGAWGVGGWLAVA